MVTPMTDVNYDSLYSSRHPEYENTLAHWEFCDETYRGGREWFEKHLMTYQKEGPKEFADRKKRASRFNHTREAVELVQKYLFKAPAKRDTQGAPESVAKFWQRSMRNGLGIDQLVRIGSTRNSVLGRVAVVVDNNLRAKVGDTDVVSVADAEESGYSIYAYVVQPQDIMDYAFDDDGDGQLLWIRLREFTRDDKDPFKSNGTTWERQRLWTRDGWYLFERPRDKKGMPKKGEAELITQGEHNLGRVPVYLFDHSVSDKKYAPPSLIDDIAYLDRQQANYMSNLDAIIQDQTFSQLAIPAQALGGDQTQAKENIVEMGTKRLFTYDGSGPGKPEYLSPDPKQAGVIHDTISKIINEIYHTIGLAGERTKQDNSVGIDNSSGVAKAYDFERVNSLLLSKAKQCEVFENWLVSIVCDWAGETQPEEQLVTYPETFDVAGLADEMVIAEALSKIGAPMDLRKEHMLIILEKMFPQVTKERYAELKKSIEAWKLEDTVPVAKQMAADAKPAAAPNRQGSVTSDTK